MNLGSAVKRDDRITFQAADFEGVNGDAMRANQELRVHRVLDGGGKVVLEAYDESGACRIVTREAGGQHRIGYETHAMSRGVCSDIMDVVRIDRSEREVSGDE